MNRVRRRYIATIALLGAASLALILGSVLKGEDRISYDLPELAQVALADVDQVIIERPETTITLSRSGDSWTVDPGDYPADAAGVRYIANQIVELSITDVVSVSDDPSRFDLSEDTRVRVTLLGNGEELRSIDIGRRAATFGHTFVRVPGDNRILQAAGEIRTYYDRDVDAYRYRQVLNFDPAAVTGVQATVTVDDGSRVTATARRTKDGWIPDVPAAVAGEFDAAALESSLLFFSSLPAYRYRYDSAEPSGSPWLEIRFIAEETHTLTVYDQEGPVYPAVASDSPYSFDMLSFQPGLILNPLGIETAGE